MNEPYLVFKQCLAILPGAQVLAPLYAAVLAEDDWPEAVKLARDALWSRASDARAESDAITSLPSWSKAGLDLRQYEIAKTMTGIGNYTVAYARSLVTASSPDQLVNPGKPKAHRRISSEQMEEIERELANLQGEVERIEETFAADHLDLVLATSYVRSLLRNAEVDRYLMNYQGELRQQFQEICDATALASEAAE